MVETVKMPGKGRIEITGQLGDVMKESVKTALGFIKSNWRNLEKYQTDGYLIFEFYKIDKLILSLKLMRTLIFMYTFLLERLPRMVHRQELRSLLLWSLYF